MTLIDRLEALCSATGDNPPNEHLFAVITEGVVTMVKRDLGATTIDNIATHIATTVARYAPVTRCRVVLQLPGLAAVTSSATNPQRRELFERTNASELLSLRGSVIGTLAVDDIPNGLLEQRFAERVAEAVIDTVDRYLAREADRGRALGIATIALIDMLPAAFTVERAEAVIDHIVDLPGVSGATLAVTGPAELPGFDGIYEDTFTIVRGDLGKVTVDHQFRCGTSTVTLTLSHASPLFGEQTTAVEAVVAALRAAVDSIAGSIERTNSDDLDPETGLWVQHRFTQELETLTNSTRQVGDDYAIALFDTPRGTAGTRLRVAIAAQLQPGDLGGRWSDGQLALARRDVALAAFADDIATMLRAASSVVSREQIETSTAVSITGTAVRAGDAETLMCAAQQLLADTHKGDIVIDLGT